MKKFRVVARGSAREFVSLVESIRAPFSAWDAWRVSVELMFYSLTEDEQKWQDAFQQIREHDPEYDKKLGVVMGSCMSEMRDEPRDILGEAYMAYGSSDKKRFAQFFTPDFVAQSMAQTLLSETKEKDWTKPGGLRVLEPSVGAGVMLIHVLNEILAKEGKEAVARTTVDAVDLDEMCCMMTTIQLHWWSLAHAPIGMARVMQGDFLASDDTWRIVCAFGATPSLAQELPESSEGGGEAAVPS